MKTFNLLFVMPQNEELFISAWAAIHTFEMKLKNNNYPVTVTIVAKETWLTKILIPSIVFMVDSLKETEGMKFELAIDMSDDRMTSLAPFGKTAASCYGTLLGFEFVNELVKIPDVDLLYDICIISWNENSHDFATKISNQVTKTIRVHEENIDKDIKLILQSKIVIGRRSIATHLASCLNRNVIEFYSLDQYPRNFLAKWSNPRYKMIQVPTLDAIEDNYQLLARTLQGVLKNVQRVS